MVFIGKIISDEGTNFCSILEGSKTFKKIFVFWYYSTPVVWWSGKIGLVVPYLRKILIPGTMEHRTQNIWGWKKSPSAFFSSQ
jgi:hypothetical protein